MTRRRRGIRNIISQLTLFLAVWTLIALAVWTLTVLLVAAR